MNNENLNDFYNQTRFNRKLRERVDSYEPELSDSLWDRIEHDLVKKESRSKRVLWMVYLLAGLLLLSTAGIYYLASENRKLAEVVKSVQVPENLVNKNAGQDEPVIQYQMPETIVEGIQVKPENVASQASGNPVSEAGPSGITSISGESAIVPATERPSNIFISNNTSGNSSSTDLDVLNSSGAFDAGEDVSITALSIQNKAFPIPVYFQKHRNMNILQEHISTKGIIYPKLQPYFGLVSEFGSTRQKLRGTHVARFNHEHAMLYKSSGLKFGMLLRNGLSFESGIQFSKTGSNLWYDRVQSETGDTIPGLQLLDSLISGNIHAVNVEKWIDFPIQIGYRYRLNSRWSLHSQLGLTYSFINSYSGLEPNPEFSNVDVVGTTRPQPFQNFWSMNLGLGLGYQIGTHWLLDLQGNYRNGLTKMNSVTNANHPNRTAQFVSGKLGLCYIIR